MRAGPPPRPATTRVVATSRAKAVAAEHSKAAKAAASLMLSQVLRTFSKEPMTELAAALLMQRSWRAQRAAAMRSRMESNPVQARLALINKVALAPAKGKVFYDGEGGKPLQSGWERVEGCAESSWQHYYQNVALGRSTWTPQWAAV